MQADRAAAPAKLPLRPQDEVECRRCGVHCDKVVYPGTCVERSCPFLYAYEDHGHTFVGCMQKVFDVEIDLGLLLAARRTLGGFGAVRARARPLPMCHVEVDPCYERARGRDRLHQPRVLRGSGRAAELPRLRPGSQLARRQTDPAIPRDEALRARGQGRLLATDFTTTLSA